MMIYRLEEVTCQQDDVCNVAQAPSIEKSIVSRSESSIVSRSVLEPGN